MSRGFDFTAYKRSSLMRRTLVRMQNIGFSGFANYQDFLQVDPEEFTRLFNTILINVTGFLRDPPTWEYLTSKVLPDMLGPSGATHSVRVWSAGCASGEEAYSIAMLLAERLGVDQFRDRCPKVELPRRGYVGLRSDEAVHKNLLNLDFGLPTDQLKAPLRSGLAGGHEEVILDATNRRGKAMRLKVSCTPLVSPTKPAVSGVILVMEPLDGRF